MDAAVIAVIGTLGGVVITALAGIATALMTGRNQRALADTQAERDLRKSALSDRRRDFATFLQAYDDVFAGGEGLFARATAGETTSSQTGSFTPRSAASSRRTSSYRSPLRARCGVRRIVAWEASGNCSTLR